MNNIHKQFFIKYKLPFFSNKFLLNNIQELNVLKFIRYNINVNKYSLMNTFWAVFLLLGQLPLLESSVKKQTTDKLMRSALTITQKFNGNIIYIYKLINFFLLTSATEIFSLKKYAMANNLRLEENSYYSELTYFPRFFLNSFNLNINLVFTNIFSWSLFEKVTLFRFLQLPIDVEFTKHKIKRKRVVYKKAKVNKIK